MPVPHKPISYNNQSIDHRLAHSMMHMMSARAIEKGEVSQTLWHCDTLFKQDGMICSQPWSGITAIVPDQQSAATSLHQSGASQSTHFMTDTTAYRQKRNLAPGLESGLVVDPLLNTLSAIATYWKGTLVLTNVAHGGCAILWLSILRIYLTSRFRPSLVFCLTQVAYCVLLLKYLHFLLMMRWLSFDKILDDCLDRSAYPF
jgi:hypothetical protein